MTNPPDLLNEAARLYLSGDTTAANAIVAQARELAPDYFEKMTAETQPLRDDLAEAVAAGKMERHAESDRYTNDHVLAYWNSARDEIAAGYGANGLVYRLIVERIGATIRERSPDGVLDFGCAYGQALKVLADRFPAVNVAGVDRQASLRELNANAFNAPNLRYLDGSVFDALPKTEGGRKLLFHTRTGIMVYPAFLNRLYRQARETGYRFVALYEIASLSCVSWTYRDQGYGFAAEAHRSTMFIHDYASALRDAGFSDVKIERMPHGYSLPQNPMQPGDTYVFIVASA